MCHTRQGILHLVTEKPWPLSYLQAISLYTPWRGTVERENKNSSQPLIVLILQTYLHLKKKLGIFDLEDRTAKIKMGKKNSKKNIKPSHFSHPQLYQLQPLTNTYYNWQFAYLHLLGFCPLHHQNLTRTRTVSVQFTILSQGSPSNY